MESYAFFSGFLFFSQPFCFSVFVSVFVLFLFYFILFYFSGFGADLLSFVGVFVFPLHTPTLFFC